MKWKNIKPALRLIFETKKIMPPTTKSWKEINGFVRQGKCCGTCTHSYLNITTTCRNERCKLGGFVIASRNYCDKYDEG